MAAQTDANKQSGNIDPGTPGSLKWQSNDPHGSLAQLLLYVESEANKAISWYWRHKRWKAKCSRLIQMSAIVLTALAGIFPVVAYLLKQMKWPYPSESGLWASLFVGLAAALIGLDRAFGLSSGWTRYVLAATSIRKLLEEFRLDCALLSCQAGQDLTGDRITAVVQRAKDFRLAVENVVFQETKDWATEFQNNLTQLEKDVRAQFDLLKGELEKAKQQEVVTGPGALEVAILNASKADDHKIEVTLEGMDSKLIKETLEGGNRWVHIGVIPGQYRVMLKAAIASRPVTTSIATIVKAGEISRMETSLPE